MEQACRPALDDHGHRTAGLGSSVLITRTWYKTYGRPLEGPPGLWKRNARLQPSPGGLGNLRANNDKTPQAPPQPLLPGLALRGLGYRLGFLSASRQHVGQPASGFEHGWLGLLQRRAVLAGVLKLLRWTPVTTVQNRAARGDPGRMGRLPVKHDLLKCGERFIGALARQFAKIADFSGPAAGVAALAFDECNSLFLVDLKAACQSVMAKFSARSPHGS